ncbi:MAG: cell division protein SepF [Bacilli bacterium]
MGLNIKKWFVTEEPDVLAEGLSDQYYDLKAGEAIEEDGSTKLVLLEPRAFSETQQIADQLKNRNTVVVNLKRVTSEQAKRIVDFLSGTIYAIGGDLQKVGGGIFLCTPNNVKVNGKITDETEGKDIHDNADINIEW